MRRKYIFLVALPVSDTSRCNSAIITQADRSSVTNLHWRIFCQSVIDFVNMSQLEVCKCLAVSIAATPTLLPEQTGHFLPAGQSISADVMPHRPHANSISATNSQHARRNFITQTPSSSIANVYRHPNPIKFMLATNSDHCVRCAFVHDDDAELHRRRERSGSSGICASRSFSSGPWSFLSGFGLSHAQKLGLFQQSSPSTGPLS